MFGKWESILLKPQFLDPDSIDILGWVVLCCVCVGGGGGVVGPGHGTMLYCFPGLYPVDASYTFPKS